MNFLRLNPISKAFFFFTIALVYQSNAFAQRPSNSGSGSNNKPSFLEEGNNAFGKLLENESKEPIPFANILFLNPQDSTLTNGATTDENGRYQLFLAAEVYLVKVQYVGMETAYRNNVRINENTVNRIPPIFLTKNTQKLDEVTVQAERSSLEFKLDKKVFNVGKDLSNAGGDAEQLLDNIPSVNVETDGSISLRGSDGVRVLINGKRSGLVGSGGDTSGLAAIPASLIERVEVITNPGAKFEASGSGGIINIILKKKTKPGFFGSVSVNGGNPDLGGLSLNLSTKRKNATYNFNYGLRYRDRPGDFIFNDTFLNVAQEAENINSRRNNRVFNRIDLSNNLALEASYDLNDKNTLTLKANTQISDRDNFQNITFDNFNFLGENLVNYQREENSNNDRFSYEFEVNHDINWKDKKSKLTSSINFNQSSSESNNLNDLLFINGSSDQVFIPEEFRNFNTSANQRFDIQSDYSKTFRNKLNLELGVLLNTNQTLTDFQLDNLVNNVWVTDPSITNNFEFNQTVSAAYLSGNKEFGKMGLKLGIRYEHTQINSILKQTNQRDNQDYGNFFPNVAINYNLTKNTSIQASMSTRIRRPRNRMLNPFQRLSDNLNRFQGNPTLLPAITYSYELNLKQTLDKMTFTAGLFWRNEQQSIQRVRDFTTDNLGNRITVSSFANLEKRDNYGVELILNGDLLPFWRITASTLLFNSVLTAGDLFEGNNDNVNGFVTNARLSNNFKFGKKTSLQISGILRGGSPTIQGERSAFGFVNIGLNRNIFSRKGSISLTVFDLLNTFNIDVLTLNERQISDARFNFVNRTVTLSFTYRFGKNNSARRRRSSRGSRGSDSGGGMDSGMDF